MVNLNLKVEVSEKEALQKIAKKELGSNNMTGAVKFLIKKYNKENK